jgi:hypothetical protein
LLLLFITLLLIHLLILLVITSINPHICLSTHNCSSLSSYSSHSYSSSCWSSFLLVLLLKLSHPPTQVTFSISNLWPSICTHPFQIGTPSHFLICSSLAEGISMIASKFQKNSSLKISLYFFLCLFVYLCFVGHMKLVFVAYVLNVNHLNIFVVWCVHRIYLNIVFFYSLHVFFGMMNRGKKSELYYHCKCVQKFWFDIHSLNNLTFKILLKNHYFGKTHLFWLPQLPSYVLLLWKNNVVNFTNENIIMIEN